MINYNRFKNCFAGFLRNRRIKEIEKYNRKIIDEAKEKYQIKEVNKELWLTFLGLPICPFSLFNEEPLSALHDIRKSYAERNGVSDYK